MLKLEFLVIGQPAPQGSKVPLGRGRFKEQSPYLLNWRNDVAHKAISAMDGSPPTPEPVHVTYHFYFARPKSHYIANDVSRGVLKAGAPKTYCCRTPDLDKLVRSTNDAMSGIIFHDDRQVCSGTMARFWSHDGSQGCFIVIQQL